MGTVGFLKIKVFLNKVYDVITFIHDNTNKNFIGESNYIVDVVM